MSWAVSGSRAKLVARLCHQPWNWLTHRRGRGPRAPRGKQLPKGPRCRKAWGCLEWQLGTPELCPLGLVSRRSRAAAFTVEWVFCGLSAAVFEDRRWGEGTEPGQSSPQPLPVSSSSDYSPPPPQGLALAGKGGQPGRLTPLALPPQPRGRKLNHKASLQFPSPNRFLPRVGTRNSRLVLSLPQQTFSRELHREERGVGGLQAGIQAQGQPGKARGTRLYP